MALSLSSSRTTTTTTKAFLSISAIMIIITTVGAEVSSNNQAHNNNNNKWNDLCSPCDFQLSPSSDILRVRCQHTHQLATTREGPGPPNFNNGNGTSNNNNVAMRLEGLLWCGLGKTGREDPRSLREVHVSGGRVPELDFAVLKPYAQLRVLNVSGNGIGNVTWGECDLSRLEVLDLSDNELVDIPSAVFTCNPHLKELDLKGNNWNCHLLEWFIDWVREAEKRGLSIIDKREIQCTSYVHSVDETAMYKGPAIWDMIESCPQNCSCVLRYGKTMVVDCSGRNFINFPDTIPNNTRHLIIQNNAIRSFQKLIQTNSYRKLTRLEMADNAIGSLAELEGIHRTITITTLDISGNRITHLPAHVVEQMKLTFLKLGRNPWNCDCESGTALRNYLTDHFRGIRDIDNITCSSADKNHPGKLVRRLSPVDLCYVPVSELHILDIVNVFLGLLIVIIQSKLIYDWLYFRRTGKLPLSPKAYFVLKYQAWKDRKYENCFDVERRSLSDRVA